jgi:hypothetical protein
LAGVDATTVLSADLVNRDGDLPIVSHAGGSLQFDVIRMPDGPKVSFFYSGTCPELVDVLKLARAGVITPRLRGSDWRIYPRSTSG